VLPGEPEFYGRFGFKASPDLVLEGVPPEYLLALSLGKHTPTGRVT